MVLTSGGLHHCFNILSSQRMQADQSTQNVENCSCVCLCTCSHVRKCVMQQWVSGDQPVNLKVTASSGLALLMRFLILFFFFSSWSYLKHVSALLYRVPVFSPNLHFNLPFVEPTVTWSRDLWHKMAARVALWERSQSCCKWRLEAVWLDTRLFILPVCLID